MSSPRKPPVKRKAMEEKVLAKARKFVKLSEPSEEKAEEPTANVPTITMDLVLKIKLRKPRTGKKVKTEGIQPKLKQDVTETQSSKKSKSKKKKRKKKNIPQQAVATAASESGQKHFREAMQYLKTWNSNRSEWKFEKLKQIYLLKNAIKSEAIDEENFPIVLKYVGSVKGRAREAFLHEMEDVVKKFEAAFPETSETIPSPEEKGKYDRARQLVQMLYVEDSE